MRTGRRPSGGVSITEMSRRPASDICSVRGIGVAESESTSTRSLSWRSSSFCLTPKRCSSSTITRPEVGGADVAREQAVGADQDVDLAVGEPGERRLDLGRPAQPRDHLDLEREAAEPLAERAEVLLGEDRRRDQHHHLLALRRRLVGGAQRDLGLAVADVAADQPVHRAVGLHVALHRLDRLDLVGGLAVGEALLEVELPLAVGPERVALARLALGVEVEELAGEHLGGAAGARLDRVPALRAERRELRRVAAGADVAGDLRELVGRREDLVLAAVLELEVVAGDAGERLRLEAREARDAVVLVDDVVADPQVGERHHPPASGRRRRRAAAVDEAAERDHREPQLGRDEAVGQRRLRRTSARPRAPAGRRGTARRSGSGCSGCARPRPSP